MHCHVNPFMMNNFHFGCHCGYNYYNPFGATRRFMMQAAMNFGMLQQYYAMLPYQMAFGNNIFAQPYQTFQPVMPQVSYPQFIMPQVQQPSINYAEIFRNYYNNLKTDRSKTPSTASAPTVSSVASTPVVDTGKLDRNVLNRVKQMAQNLNCDYKDLLAVINNESGFNTKAQNGGAVGLIQFTQAARDELKRVYGINVTKEQILNMSAIEQLDLAEKYLKVAKSYHFGANDRLSGADLYAIVFLPGRANREVLCVRGEAYYEQNPMDENHDGRLTKSDLQARLNKKRVNESIFA